MWKTIEEFSDYEVSDAGMVMRTVARPWHPCRLLTGWVHSTGCTCVSLNHGNRRRSARVHILVAKAFIPNPLNLPTVNHKDGDKTHNDVSNLEWASSERQIVHAIQTGLHKTKGYGFHKASGKWTAYIESKGVRRHLGLFPTEQQAIGARQAAEKIYHNLEEIV
jgi:hypothetical protein